MKKKQPQKCYNFYERHLDFDFYHRNYNVQLIRIIESEMRKALLTFTFLIIFHLTGISQILNIHNDTININLRGRLGPSICFNEKYYCFFETSNMGYSSQSTNHFYILSHDAKIIKKVDVPDGLQESYCDLHVRNDSVIVKSYYTHTSYYLDTLSNVWIKIPEVDDKVYEDENYYMNYLDFGEWGGTLWFKDKYSGIEYEFASSDPIINRIRNNYFVSTGRSVYKIEDPKSLKRCSPDYLYKLVEAQRIKREKVFEGSRSYVGAKSVFEDSVHGYFSDFSIVTSFVVKDQLYHLCVDSNLLYIATIQNGKMEKAQTICSDIKVYHSINSYRYPNIIKHSQSFRFNSISGEYSGLIEVSDSNILLHYFKSTCKEYYLGTDKAKKEFNQLFILISKQIENLNLSQIDSIENNWGATDLTQRHMMYFGDLTKKLDLETPRVYYKIEDSTFTMLTEYFYTKTDKKIKAVAFNWKKTDNNERVTFPNFENKSNQYALNIKKFNEVESFVTNLVGKPKDIQRTPKRTIINWEMPNGHLIELYCFDLRAYLDIRLIIY